MIQITVFDREDQAHVLDGPTDMNLNLMELCKAYELPVLGTCGGMALCSTCHVYVLSDHDVLDRNEAEEEMLDQTFFVQSNSRLGCQVRLTEDIDGLVVKLAPEAQ